MNIHLYKQENIDQLDWSAYQGGSYARNFLLPMITQSPSLFIQNADCDIQIMTVDQHLFPIVLGKPDASIKNSYVCSPFSQYIDYGKREVEIELSQKTWLKWIAFPILNLIGAFCKWGKIEEVVFVNNWLLSTNLYDEFDLSQLAEIHAWLLHQYPNKVIIFRSVNDVLNAHFLQSLKEMGYRDILSRQVYIINPNIQAFAKKRAYKIDLKLWNKLEGYEWTDTDHLSTSEIHRIKHLYDDLYLNKYSRLNPQFTIPFIQHAISHKTLYLKLLRHQGKIVAVIGYFVRDGVMTTPLVGYDASYPKTAALYRLLTLKTIWESVRLGVMFNMSSGASHFKRLRGAEPAIEYNLVYTKAVSWRRSMPWRLLEKLSNWIVIPMMRKMGL